MKKLFVLSATAFFLAGLPAVAQEQPGSSTKPAGTETTLVDCETNWKQADANSDGMLSKSEISASRSLIPTSLGSSNAISKTDFLTACQQQVRGAN